VKYQELYGGVNSRQVGAGASKYPPEQWNVDPVSEKPLYDPTEMATRDWLVIMCLYYYMSMLLHVYTIICLYYYMSILLHAYTITCVIFLVIDKYLQVLAV